MDFLQSLLNLDSYCLHSGAHWSIWLLGFFFQKIIKFVIMLSSDKILLMVINEFSSFLICTVFQQQLKRMFKLLFAKLMVYKAKLMKHFSLKMEVQQVKHKRHSKICSLLWHARNSVIFLFNVRLRKAKSFSFKRIYSLILILFLLISRYKNGI